MSKPTILMIDDDPVFLEGYKSLLKDEYKVTGVQDIPNGLECIKKLNPDILLLDISMRTEKEGLAALPDIKEKYPYLPIIIVTNWDSHLIFKQALNSGADDFFVKSDNVNHLKIIIKNQLVKKDVTAKNKTDFPIAQSQKFKQILNESANVAKTNCTVLLTGETGVGKEIVAQYIHKHSRRYNEPFITINCGAVPETLLESELFGHKKGAFTDAVANKKGKFEAADRGTLFLDELEELPLKSQTKLLRVIQNKEIEPIGSTQTISINVRIISATQKNLKELVDKGIFRKDLYYRLAVYPINIPPLRERQEDILPLCYYFLDHFQREYKISKKQFTQSFLIMLKNYHWPGNVRELQNTVENAVVRSKGKEIRPADFLLQTITQKTELLSYDSAKANIIREFQQNYIRSAIFRNQGNISQTAKEIGISRQALSKIIQDLDLDIKNQTKN